LVILTSPTVQTLIAASPELRFHRSRSRRREKLA
jgi:hypothetical protein